MQRFLLSENETSIKPFITTTFLGPSLWEKAIPPDVSQDPNKST